MLKNILLTSTLSLTMIPFLIYFLCFLVVGYLPLVVLDKNEAQVHKMHEEKISWLGDYHAILYSQSNTVFGNILYYKRPI